MIFVKSYFAHNFFIIHSILLKFFFFVRSFFIRIVQFILCFFFTSFIIICFASNILAASTSSWCVQNRLISFTFLQFSVLKLIFHRSVIWLSLYKRVKKKKQFDSQNIVCVCTQSTWFTLIFILFTKLNRYGYFGWEIYCCLFRAVFSWTNFDNNEFLSSSSS